MEKKEFIVQYRTSRQISPDDWEVINRTVKIHEGTTIKEVLEWFREDNKTSDLNVNIIQLKPIKD